MSNTTHRGAEKPMRMTAATRVKPSSTARLPADNTRWWLAAVTARRMTLEYMKYLAVLGREGVRRLTRDRPAAAATPISAAEEKAPPK